MPRLPAIAATACALLLALEGSTCDRRHVPPEGTAPPPQAKVLSPVWAGPAMSGSWYTDTRSGEGFALQVLENGSALVVWFTYPPTGSSAQQAWILGLEGRLDGDRIRFDNAFTTRGPRFGPAFDPAQVQVIPWGSIEIRFTGCNAGELAYAGPAAWGSGTRPLVRLTAVSELECTGKRQLHANGARAIAGLRSRSGSWFDPAHNGEGWQVEELPDGRAQVYWFTYDPNGEQAWMLGTASSSGDRIDLGSVYRPVGARFGTGFDPAGVQLAPWGRLTLQFEGCDAGQVNYQSDDSAFGSGTLRPVRLSRLAGTACHAATPTAPAAGTWSAGALMPGPQSEHAVTMIGNTICGLGGFGATQGFKCYDPVANAWTSRSDIPAGRDHALAVTVGDDVLYLGGYRTDSSQAQSINGWRYRISQGQWEALPQMPDPLASGAAVLGGYAYFATISGALYQVNPRTLAFRAIPRDERAPRDHSQLVAFQGELWLLGGRAASGTANTVVSIFDPASETWRAGPSMPTSRSGFAAAASDTVLIVAGGEKISQPMRVHSEVEALAAGAAQWQGLPPLPFPMHGFGGVIQGNAFITIGGSRVAATAVNEGQVQIYRW